MSIFNADFYPTPPEVAAEMLDPLDLRRRTVLEPSAGSGNLVRECLARGAAEVLWCEKEPQLLDLLTTQRSGGSCCGGSSGRWHDSTITTTWRNHERD